MITIPNKNLHQMHYDNLSILWEALFLELEDNRLVAFISPEEFEERVDAVRDSPNAEKLYDMLQVFGEPDLYTYVKPALVELQEINPRGEDYIGVFTKCFNKL